MFVKIFDAFIDGMERQSKQLCSMMEHKFKYSNVLNDIKIILSRKKLFECSLSNLIITKYEKYERETIHYRWLKLHKSEREEDTCPVCYECVDNLTTGDNCVHKICEICYDKIMMNNNLCPICRKRLLNVESDNDSDDDSDDNPIIELFCGTNEIPEPYNYAPDIRLYNVETNKIMYSTPSGWAETDRCKIPLYRLIQRYSDEDDNDITLQNCYMCGIQKTQEVNELMKRKHNTFLLPPEEEGEPEVWDSCFNWDYAHCYECELLMRNVFGLYNKMFYEDLINNTNP